MNTSLKVSLFGMMLAAGCSGEFDEASSTGTILDQVTAPGGLVSATAVIESEWQGGYCAKITVANAGTAPTTSWSVVLNSPGVSIASSWNAEYSVSSGKVTARPLSWNAAIPAQGSATFGYCANATGGNPTIESVSATGGGGGSGGTSSGGTGGASSGGTGGTSSGGTGGASSGGTGGTSSGGTGGTASGGTGGTATGGTSSYPCDGSTSGYDAIVSKSGSTWTARRGSRTVYTGSDMRAAMQAGVDSLSAGRTTKQRVLVQGSGSISANSRVSLPSYTLLNVCGTINVTGSGSGDMAPIYARGRRDIEIPNVNITGTPRYAMFFRDVDNLTLGRVDMRVSAGLGVRIDNHGRSDRSQKVRNIRIDHVYAERTGSHGVETYGVDGLTIGTVIARNTGECGLLLNDTVNATVGTVDAQGAGTGTGYAAFRLANRAGRIGSSYPTNIRVGSVIARGGGRGIFCVSESGGATIDRVDIAQTGNNSILLENCHNVNIAAVSGSVSGRDVRIASRSEFPVSSNITLQNLTLTNTTVGESPCGTNTVVRNNTLIGSRLNICSASNRGGNVSR